MKNMILVLAISFLSMNAFAGAREFRVNGWATSTTGYAIAWGVNGANTDFEALDKLSHEELVDFIEGHDVRNYLVDLGTNQILLDLSGAEGGILELEAGETHWGNHFSISIGDMVMPYSEGRDIVPVISNYKWSASLSHVVVTKKTAAGVQVLKDDQQLEARILKAVSAKLTPSQQKKFEKGSTSISMHASQDGRNTEITWIAEVPKSLEDPIITVKANVEFKLDDKDNILVKLIKVSYKED